MNFNELIQDPKADLSVAMLTTVDDKLCFVIQPKNRWGKNELEQTTIPFGGIGGKVESGEDLLSALSRECQEEVGCSCEIIPNNKKFIPIISNDGVAFTEIKNAPYGLPEFIFKNKKSEPGRKDYTYVFVYKSKLLDVDKIKPLDNPAIIMMDQDLFMRVVQNEMTLAQAVQEGAKVQTTITLPADGVLWPTPTPRGYVQLLKYTQSHSRK